MLVGYARTSTAEQAAGLAAQERDLKRAGCERVFSEQVSSVAQRLQLAAALGSDDDPALSARAQEDRTR